MYIKKIIPLLLFLFVLLLNAFAKQPGTLQVTMQPQRDTVPITDTNVRIFEKVEIEASFPGGDDAWRRYLEKNLNASVPLKYKAPAGYYTVVVQFVVDREGNISDVKALTSHGFGMEQEVVRVIKKGPKWRPAIQDGRQVRAYRKQPVTFWIEEEKETKKKNKD